MVDQNILDSVYEFLSEEASTNSLSNFIEIKCQELDISQRQLSDFLDVPRRSLQRILEGEAQKVDVFTLMKISQFFGIDIKELIQVYLAESSSDEVRQLEKARKAGYIIRTFDLRTLKSIGFIESSKDFEQIESRIKAFFNLNSLFHYSELLSTDVAFSKTKRSRSEKMLGFWVSIVHYQLSNINNPFPFDLEKVKQIIPKLRVSTADTRNGFSNFVRALYRAGVVVIYESHIPKTQIRGGTFVVNGRPCIVVTTFNNRYDTMWFALGHELCHVVVDLPLLKNQTYHLSGDQSLFNDDLIEKNADEFASELLLPKERVDQISRFINSEGIVNQYAREWGVHPSIVYGRYLHYYPDDYAKYRNRLLKSHVITNHMEVIPWQQENLETTIQQLETTQIGQMN